MVDDKGFAYILVGKMDGDTMSDEKVFSPDTQGTLEATQYFQELSDKQEFKDNPPPPPPPPPTDPHQQPPPPPPPPPQDEKQYFYRLRKDNNTTLTLAMYEYDPKAKTAQYMSDDIFNVQTRNADGTFFGTLNSTQDEGTLKRNPMFDGEGMDGYEMMGKKDDDKHKDPKDQKNIFYRLKDEGQEFLDLIEYELDPTTNTENELGEKSFFVLEKKGDDFDGIIFDNQPASMMSGLTQGNTQLLKREPKFDGNGMLGYVLVKEGKGGKDGDKVVFYQEIDSNSEHVHVTEVQFDKKTNARVIGGDYYFMIKEQNGENYKGKLLQAPQPNITIKEEDEEMLIRTPPLDFDGKKSYVLAKKSKDKHTPPPPPPPPPPDPKDVIEAVEDALIVDRGELKNKYPKRESVNALMRDLFNESEIRAIGEKFGYTGNKSQILKTIDTALRTLYND
jgi:hypothetical protein